MSDPRTSFVFSTKAPTTYRTFILNSNLTLTRWSALWYFPQDAHGQAFIEKQYNTNRQKWWEYDRRSFGHQIYSEKPRAGRAIRHPNPLRWETILETPNTDFMGSVCREFYIENASGWNLLGTAIVEVHCHQRVIGRTNSTPHEHAARFWRYYFVYTYLPLNTQMESKSRIESYLAAQSR